MNALIVTAAPSIELPESIVYAYASKEEITRFVQQHLGEINKEQLSIAGYAMARAMYRDGEDLYLGQLASLVERTIEGTQYWVRKLFRIDGTAETKLTNDQCSSVMCAIMEM